ncbi:MAG TPA: CHAD domain-containing protein [Bryobacteraceae bacterium]
MKTDREYLDNFAEAQLRLRLRKTAATARHAAGRPGEAENIHNLRVAIRRFTQALRVFRDLLDRSHVRKMRRELHKIMELCGDIRDCDIAKETIDAAGVPASGALERHLRKARSRAERDLEDLLSHSRISKIKSWDAWLRPKAGLRQTIAGSARKTLVPLTRQFFKTAEAAWQTQSTVDEMHRFRLLAKRLRYSLEIFGPAASRGWQRRVDEIRALQERLGAVNDCATTLDLLNNSGNGPKRALEGLLAHRIQEFRTYRNGHFGANVQRSWLAQLRRT